MSEKEKLDAQVEEEVVDKSAVTDGGIKYLDVRSVSHQITFAFHNVYTLLFLLFRAFKC